MPLKYHLEGQQFGRLTVQYRCNFFKGRAHPWHCICECGQEVDVSTHNLVSGKTKSCGCLQKEKASQIGKKTIDNARQYHIDQLLGKRFGRLLVIENTYQVKNHTYVWKCLCDCGNITYVRTTDLTKGNTLSCGCLISKGQAIIEKILLENNIIFQKEYICYNAEKQYEQRFDFYVNNEYFIEYDGIQHFQEVKYFQTSLKEQQIKDVYKNQWCKANNIPLIRIPYTHLNNICLKDLLLETSDFII